MLEVEPGQLDVGRDRHFGDAALHLLERRKQLEYLKLLLRLLVARYSPRPRLTLANSEAFILIKVDDGFYLLDATSSVFHYLAHEIILFFGDYGEKQSLVILLRGHCDFCEDLWQLKELDTKELLLLVGELLNDELHDLVAFPVEVHEHE